MSPASRSKGRARTHASGLARTVGWGAAAAVVYLLVGAGTWPAVPLRILYEGEAPPLPYRWMHPPANLPEPNQAPTPGDDTIPLTPAGSQSASVLTADGQAALIFRFGAIAPRAGATAVLVHITPLDPGTLPAVPVGLEIDGNAYRMQASYNTDGAIRLLKPVTPVLRYPRHATVLLRLSGTAWTRLETHIVAGSLQLFGPADALGIFAAARPAGASGSDALARRAGIAAAALGVILALALLLVMRRRSAGRRQAGASI